MVVYRLGKPPAPVECSKLHNLEQGTHAAFVLQVFPAGSTGLPSGPSSTEIALGSARSALRGSRARAPRGELRVVL
jgi:hypothetical protein